MDKLRVSCKCPLCKKVNEVELDESAWWHWQMGMHIQNAAPELSAEEREMLISGTCPNCWNKMFGGR